MPSSPGRTCATTTRWCCWSARCRAVRDRLGRMRPEILFPLFAPITALKGVGSRIAPLLERVAGPLVRDVLFTAPQSLVRRTVVKAAAAIEGQEQTLIVTIESVQRPGRRGLPWKIRAFDDTGFVTLVFFRVYEPDL